MSPVRTETPLLGAEVVLAPGTTWELAVDPGFEHGVLVDTGHVDVDGVRLDSTVLGVRDAGKDSLRLSNPTDAPARPTPFRRVFLATETEFPQKQKAADFSQRETGRPR